MAETKKVVINVHIHDEKDKRKALQAVSCVSGIDKLAIEMKDQKLTIIGNMDPLCVAKKLKKWYTGIYSVDPEKKPEEKKLEENKPKGGENKANEDSEKRKREEEEEAIRRFIEAQRAYNPCMCMNQRYYLHPVEEEPRGCVIC